MYEFGNKCFCVSLRLCIWHISALSLIVLKHFGENCGRLQNLGASGDGAYLCWALLPGMQILLVYVELNASIRQRVFTGQSCMASLVSTLSGRYDVVLIYKAFSMSVTSPFKSERIDVRASLPVKHLLQEAARATHKNVSEFLLEAGVVAANQTLADRIRFEISPEKWSAFQMALDQPVGAKPRLKKLLNEPGILG